MKDMTLNGSINVSVSSHYRTPSYASEITSQGILGERVQVLEHHPPFTRVRQVDGYESWISTDQVHLGAAPAGTDIRVKSHFVRVYREPSTSSEGVKDAVIGCTLTAEGEEEVAIGTLMSDDLLVVTVEGQTMKFTRKEIEED